MPRKRKTNQHLPPRWRQHHGAIYYQVPQDQRAVWDGKTMFRLGKTEAEAWAHWYARTEVGDDVPRTMSAAFDRYAVEVLPKKASRTQESYRSAIALLKPVFGLMPPSALKPRHVYAYMDRRPPIAANREKATLSAVMTECVRWGAVDRNLVREVKRNREEPRSRYVDDAELGHFLSHCSPFLKAYVRLKMLTGLRQGQLLSLEMRDWNGSQLSAPAAKGGKPVRYGGEGLAEAVDALVSLQTVEVCTHIVADRRGTPYTDGGFRAIWRRAMNKYIADGGNRFRENDLRAKVASDDPQFATDRLGHRSPSTTRRHYQRKPIEVDVLNQVKH